MEKAQKSRSSFQTSASCERQKLADELDKRYDEPCESEDINPFNWWASNQTRFPSIAVVARQYLAIPATSVASERLFSKCGLIYSNRRAALSPQHMEQLVFLSHSLQVSTPVKSSNKLTWSDGAHCTSSHRVQNNSPNKPNR